MEYRQNIDIFATKWSERMAFNGSTRQEVETFLQEFKERTRWSNPKIIYIDTKQNNVDTLAILDIVPSERDQYVLSLQPEDYYQGPEHNDIPNQGDVWMFGKYVKGKEVYIKIFINRLKDHSNVCISFHIPAFKITYPLKQQL